MDALLMYDNASVRAPAICVVVVVPTSASVVAAMSSRREVRRLSSMRAKGRYLFALSRFEAVLSDISTSSEFEGGRG